VPRLDATLLEGAQHLLLTVEDDGPAREAETLFAGDLGDGAIRRQRAP
jgi:hypothetical protein